MLESIPELNQVRTFVMEGTLLKVVILVVVVVAIWFVTDRLLAGMAKKAKSLGLQRADKIKTYIRTIRMIIRYAVIIVTVLVVLQICGVNVSALLAGLGVASVVVGLALQDALKNIIMGMNILIDGFYQVGDYLEYEGRLVRVEEMNLRMTRMSDDATNDMLIVPNSQISRSVRVSGQFDIDVPLPYEMSSAEIEETMAAVCGVLNDMPEVTECHKKGITEFGASAIYVKLRMKARPSRRNQTRRECMDAVKRVLDERGIKIPYMQVDIHTK